MLLVQPVEIVNVIRRMRGGSQAFLVQASDGHHYVAKFANNPQGNRTLINEIVAGHLLTTLGVATPDLAILHLGNACEDREDLYFSMATQQPIANGLHLGSRCPVDPDKVAIFDFLPARLYSRVQNLDDVGVVFAFDRWACHVDIRQFIFARRVHKYPTKVSKSEQPDKSILTAWAIDNGMCFYKDWMRQPNSMYSPRRPSHIYSFCNLAASSQRGAELIESLPDAEFAAARKNIPKDWFGPGDQAALDEMMSYLQRRQQGLVESIHEHVAAAILAGKRAS